MSPFSGKGAMIDWIPGLNQLDYTVRIALEGVCLLSASAAVIGCFAVLRRRALTGDALSHAALPGLCVGYLLAGEKDMSILLAGALVSGVLGIGAIALLRRYTRIKEDAAIGIVLSVFFGAGIVLHSRIQRIPGAGGQAGLLTFILGATAGMREEEVEL